MFSEVFYFQNTYHAQLQFSQEVKHINLQEPTLDTTVSINYEISCFYNYVVSPFSKKPTLYPILLAESHF